MPIGILAAMPQEIAHVVRDVRADSIHESGMRTYHRGSLHGVDCIVTLSRVGKVAAAATVMHLILEFGVSEIIFTGVAGALSPDLNVGDIVVATELIQHDLDARPLFPRFEAPLLGVSRFRVEHERAARAQRAAEQYLGADFTSAISETDRARFNLHQPRVHTGLIASGDQFITSIAARDALRDVLPDALCVEMEGAAVAQVCHEHHVPLTVIRTISDSADDDAPINFSAFMENIASEYSRGIMKRILHNSGASIY